MESDSLYRSWMDQMNPVQSSNCIDPAGIDNVMVIDTADEIPINDNIRKYPMYNLREAVEDETNPLPNMKRRKHDVVYKNFIGQVMGPDVITRHENIADIILNTIKQPSNPEININSAESNIESEEKIDIAKVDVQDFITRAFSNHSNLINEYTPKDEDEYLYETDDEIIQDEPPKDKKPINRVVLNKEQSRIYRENQRSHPIPSVIKTKIDKPKSKSLNLDEHISDDKKSKLSKKEATPKATSDPLITSHEKHVRGTENPYIPEYQNDHNFDTVSYSMPPLNTTVYRTPTLMNNQQYSSTQIPQTGEEEMINNSVNNGINTTGDVISGKNGGSSSSRGSYPNAGKPGNENLQMIGMEFQRLLMNRRNSIPDYLGAGADRYTYEIHNFTAHPVYLVNGTGHMHTLEPSSLGTLISQYGQDAVEKMLNSLKLSHVPHNINHPKLQEIFNSHAINTVVKIIEVTDSAPQMEILVTDPYLTSGLKNPVLKDYSHTDLKNNMIVTFDRNEAATFANKEGSCVAANLRYRTKDIAESLTYHFLNFSDQDLFLVDGTENRPIRIKKMTQVQRMSFFRGIHGDRNKLSDNGGVVFVKRYPSQNTDSHTDPDMFREMHVVDFISVDLVRKETYQIFFSDMCSGVLVFKDEESALKAIDAKISKTNTMFGEGTTRVFSEHLGHEKEKEKLEKKYNKMVSLAARIGLGVISIIVVVFKSNISDAAKALFGIKDSN